MVLLRGHVMEKKKINVIDISMLLDSPKKLCICSFKLQETLHLLVNC